MLEHLYKIKPCHQGPFYRKHSVDDQLVKMGQHLKQRN